MICNIKRYTAESEERESLFGAFTDIEGTWARMVIRVTLERIQALAA